MARNQRELLERFKAGKTKGSASNMFIENDTLYSYGYHFPLLIRTPYGFVLNADKYSVTTSAHQSMCFRTATLVVPFSAMQAAGLISSYGINTEDELQHIDVIDTSVARYDLIGYSRWNNTTQRMERISVSKYNLLSTKDQQDYTEVNERRPDASVLHKDGKWYLSSMDGGSYFISELPQPVQTTGEAFDCLMPEECTGMTEVIPEWQDRKKYIKLELDQYFRQGEWFFTLAREFPISLCMKGHTLSYTELQKWLYHKQMEHNYVLPMDHPDSNPHTATRGMMVNGILYVSGCVRHPQHSMVRLSKAENPVIYCAYRNRAIDSWSAGGDVD